MPETTTVSWRSAQPTAPAADFRYEPMGGLVSPPMLAHERVTAGPTPRGWLFAMHGIYGAGRNWASIGRALVEIRQDWGVVLVDLRGHGESHGFQPPHTIASAAGDVAALVDHIAAGAAGPGAADAAQAGATRGDAGARRALLGHSFGGKVALAAASLIRPEPSQVWLIDSTPAVRDPEGAAWEMLGALEALPGPFASRAEAVDAFASRGFALPVAQWMSSNLERGDEGLTWRIDPETMRALLEDFFRTDLWPALERPPEGATVHVVAATRSGVLRAEDRERVEALERQRAGVRLHRVEGGHWLNADNPDALVALLAEALPTA